MKALLVRVGVDQAFGRWNAPVDAAGMFVYVAIPEPDRPAVRVKPGQPCPSTASTTQHPR